ncbi:DUF421 domain-containing protein [Virgibacillus sp. MSP4-1]|uniref:DUF421 domain-containing protein n=1 Tax=Virgibacillus sp. MSP4-1 TaxID=2700081 RepID=UPI0003A34333|nr:YetF domain-containing protein [Virgibacillus sp. MSP4-1]QHS23037.1 DUF421 domain-containing protein [Virgibacillus sp. MSP4-1]
MLIFIGKVVFLFLLYIGAIRFLGKTALAQLTPHDFGAIFFLAYILFGAIKIDGIIEGLIAGVMIVAVYLLIAKLTLWNKLNKLLVGEPTFIIQKGDILVENLKRSRYSLTELLSTIRTAGYFDISEIDYAILEPNGEISILSKQNNHKGLAVPVIIEGEIQYQHLHLVNIDEQWLKRELTLKGYDHFNDIFLATIRDKDLILSVYT